MQRRRGFEKGETKNKNYKIEYRNIARINRILYRVGYTTMPFIDKWTFESLPISRHHGVSHRETPFDAVNNDKINGDNAPNT